MAGCMVNVAALLSLCLFICGCSTPYVIDRRHDAADVFTLTAGKNYGAKVKAGFVHCGYFIGKDIYGIRGGSFGGFGRDTQEVDASLGLYILGYGGGDNFHCSNDKKRGRKDYDAYYAYMFGTHKLVDSCPNR